MSNQSLPEKETRIERLVRIGRKGGLVTKERYGSAHFAALGRKGGLITKQQRRPKDGKE